jgi:transcriptional regulator with XRE-family HTH domain
VFVNSLVNVLTSWILSYTSSVSSNVPASQFLYWLREEMDSRRWMPKDLADRSGVTLAQVTRVLSGEQGAGAKFLRGIAEAFNMPQETVFRLAGVLNDEEMADVKEDEAARKIRRLLAALEPDERERAVRLLEQYVKDHRPEPARRARVAPDAA